jgi:hypothetical protein
MKGEVKFQTIHVVVEDKYAPAFLKKKQMAYREVGRITAAVRPIGSNGGERQFDVGFAYCSPKDLFDVEIRKVVGNKALCSIKRNYRRQKGKDIALDRLNDPEERFRISVPAGERVSDKVREAAIAAAAPTPEKFGVPWMKNITFANLSPTSI